MTSVASMNRKRRASFALIGSVAVVAVTLGAGLSRAQDVGRRADPYAHRFPNLVLRTHEGKNVRFYDDLLKGKIVLINFMYVTCKER